MPQSWPWIRERRLSLQKQYSKLSPGPKNRQHLLKIIFFAFSYLQAGAFQSFLSPRQTIFYKIQESPVEINMIFEGKVVVLLTLLLNC